LISVWRSNGVGSHGRIQGKRDQQGDVDVHSSEPCDVRVMRAVGPCRREKAMRRSRPRFGVIGHDRIKRANIRRSRERSGTFCSSCATFRKSLSAYNALMAASCHLLLEPNSTTTAAVQLRRFQITLHLQTPMVYRHT
jgi:hypothetical protein